MQVRMVVIPNKRKVPRANFYQFSDRTILGVHFKCASGWSLHSQSQYCVNHATMTGNQY